MRPAPSPEAIAKTWRWLAHGAHGVSEVRAIRPKEGVVGIGFFDEEDAFVRACLRANADANVYVGIQPRPRRLLWRAPNKMRRLRRGANAADIEVLIGTVIDLDPVRPKDEASTDGELAAALEAASQICAWSQAQGLMRPRRMMSGNGAQLWFAMPPTELTAERRGALLGGMRAFEADVRALVQSRGVHVDSIYDPARVIKVIGTVSVKGSGTPERPHRVSYPVDDFARHEDAGLVERMRATPLLCEAPGASSPAASPRRRRLPVVGNATPTAPAPLSEEAAEGLLPPMCAPVRRLWDEGAVDRSRALFHMVRYLAFHGLDLASTTALVLAFDRRVLGKLRRRDGAAYVRHAWNKVQASARADGTIVPPCHAMQRLGYCAVTHDPDAACQVYNLLFDLGAAIDALPFDPAGAFVDAMDRVLGVLARQARPTQSKYLKVLAWHYAIPRAELHRRMGCVAPGAELVAHTP